MGIELKIKWDPYRIERRPFKIIVADKDGCLNGKPTYSGRVESIQAANHFVAHIGILVNDDFPLNPKSSSGGPFPLEWDVFDEGYSRLRVQPKRMARKLVLEALRLLEEKRFIAARHEIVNDHEYTTGFMRVTFGTDTLWTKSMYNAANPGEYVLQLAYEIINGIRKPTGNRWPFFPSETDGLVLSRNAYMHIESLINANKNAKVIKTHVLVDELIAFAAAYFALDRGDFRRQYNIPAPSYVVDHDRVRRVR
jgi:hypothetical protein